jgi:hypothetical protein
MEEIVKVKKAKHGTQFGRPIRKTIDEQAPRRTLDLVSLLFFTELSGTACSVIAR